MPGSSASTGRCATRLHGEEFHSLLEARLVMGAWLDVYNLQRPHWALGMMTPAAFALAQNLEAR